MRFIRWCYAHDHGKRILQGSILPAWIYTCEWHLCRLFGRNLFARRNGVILFQLCSQYLLWSSGSLVFRVSFRYVFEV